MDQAVADAVKDAEELYGADLDQLRSALNNAGSYDEATKALDNWKAGHVYSKGLETWIADSFKLGFDSTGFHLDLDWAKVDSKIIEWAEARAFESKNLQDSYVKGWLTRYLRDYIENGKPYNDFRKQIESSLDKAGVTNLKPYHVETIFRTEGQRALNFGRRQSMEAAADVAELWEFVYVDDDNHEEGTTCYDVADMGGLILSADDPFWDENYPPCHFNCRSGVVAIPNSIKERDDIKQTSDAKAAGVSKSTLDNEE